MKLAINLKEAIAQRRAKKAKCRHAWEWYVVPGTACRGSQSCVHSRREKKCKKCGAYEWMEALDKAILSAKEAGEVP